ncbi:MAG: DUF1638 domain-containing protein [Nitrosomonadales bacterium]|nr:DUF1638 domain-containing protein [Nitrosomonadales bacterium]
MRIGVIACDIMKLELDKLLSKTPGITEIIYLEAALHSSPKKMKEIVLENVKAIKDKVDVIFLGYGYCQSLKGIENEIDIPVVMPQMEDCIQIFMTPEKHGEAVRKEIGTWFMSPGWAELGVDMVIKGNHLDRVVKYGKDPIEMAKRLMSAFRTGLYIDTGVGNDDYYIGKANEVCDIFSLTLEKTTGTSAVLEEHLEKARQIAAQASAARATE